MVDARLSAARARGIIERIAAAWYLQHLIGLDGARLDGSSPKALKRMRSSARHAWQRAKDTNLQKDKRLVATEAFCSQAELDRHEYKNCCFCCVCCGCFPLVLLLLLLLLLYYFPRIMTMHLRS